LRVSIGFVSIDYTPLNMWLVTLLILLAIR
jgi:hypothetical protein